MGYVIENPLGVYSEQPDPIPEEQFTFEVECEYDAIWTPKPLHGGTIMPRCIRKSFKYTFLFISSLISAINYTEPPFQVRNNDMGKYNWTGVDGEDPRQGSESCFSD